MLPRRKRIMTGSNRSWSRLIIEKATGIVDDHIALPHDGELVATHHDGGVFVDADSEQLWVGFDDHEEIELAIAPQ